MEEVKVPGLTKTENKSLSQVDRTAIQEQSKNSAKDLWSGKLTVNEQKALNHVCAVYGLDPSLKQVNMLGGNIYINGAGILSIVHRDAFPPEGIELVPATKQEREDAFITCSDGSKPEFQHYWKCIVWKKGSARPFTEFGEACLADVQLHGKNWKTVQDMAKTRARNRALRNAYSIGLTSIEEFMGVETTITVEEDKPEPAQIPAGKQEDKAQAQQSQPAQTAKTAQPAQLQKKQASVLLEDNPKNRAEALAKMKEMFKEKGLEGFTRELIYTALEKYQCDSEEQLTLENLRDFFSWVAKTEKESPDDLKFNLDVLKKDIDIREKSSKEKEEKDGDNLFPAEKKK